MCRRCRKKYHFESVWKSKAATNQVFQLRDNELLALDTDSKRLFSRLSVANLSVQLLLDCGSTVNLLPAVVASRLDPALVSRRPPSTRLPMFNDTKLRMKEMLTTRVQHPTTQKMLELDFYVAVTHKQANLGLDVCLAMDLLAVQFSNLCTLQAVGADESTLPTRPSLAPHSHILSVAATASATAASTAVHDRTAD